MRRLLCPVLVGRDRERARVLEAVRSSALGEGGVLLVAGPAGIGKSRLAAEVAEGAGALGATVLSGRAVPSEVPEPYRPLTEALLAAPWADVPVDAPQFAGFRPALGRLLPAWLGDEAPREASPVVVAEAFLRVLRTLPGAAQVVVLEDLHWADPETLQVVEYLADHVRTERVLVVATLRDDAVGAAAAARTRLEARRAVEVLALPPLSSGDVVTMAGECLGARDVPDSVAALLRDVAEGNPFFVEELLAAAVSSGALAPSGEGWEAAGPLRPMVPRSVAETVRARFEATGADGRRLLGCAALLGRRFDWHTAAEAAGLPREVAVATLEESVGLQLLAADGDGFRFRHALIREAILDHLMPTERAALAERSLDALERAVPPGGEWRHLAADLAEAAGAVDRAARLLLGAGRDALRRGSLATAAVALERASVLAVGPELRADAAESLAEARSATGDVHATRAATAVLLDALDGMGASGERKGQAHLLLARCAVGAGHFGLASEELARARRLALQAGDRALVARCGAVAAQLAIGEGRVGEAESLAARVVEEATAIGQDDVVCEALEVAVRCLRTRDVEEAEATSLRALELAGDRGLVVWRMRALYQLGTVELLRSGAVDRLLEAREEALRLGALATAAHLQLEIGAGLELQWRGDEARAAFERGIELAALLDLKQLEAMSNAFVAIVHATSAARRSMEAAIARALALAGDEPELVGVIWGDARAVASLAEEDRLRARSELERAVAAYGDREAVTPHLAVALAELVTAVDDEAADGTEPPRSVAGVMCQPRAYLAYAKAVRRGRAGRASDAARAVAEGDRLLALAPWYRNLSRRLVAEAAIADGWGEPEAWLREAAAFFDASGNRRIASACRGLLRRAGVRVSRPVGSAAALPPALRAAGVTAREAEVLVLVGAGLSNGEIAARLVLSERTVEHHVGWLRRKLGLRSRAQMVAFAAGAESAPDGVVATDSS